MGLLGKGWTVAAARREVGVSRTTGNRWKNGYNLCRRGQLVGFVPRWIRWQSEPSHRGSCLPKNAS
jgi:hypothetical protein